MEINFNKENDNGEITELITSDMVIVRRRIRKSSRENQINVSGNCDMCNCKAERMSLATYVFPLDTHCPCCNGLAHSFMIKFCDKCNPPSVREVFNHRQKAEHEAVEDLIRKFNKEYRTLIGKSLCNIIDGEVRENER